MDSDPQAVAVVSESLEKIAHLPQEEQVELIRTLISLLREDTAELVSQNVGMRNIIRDLDCGISQSDYDWQNVTYGDFVYQNKALKERLNRVLDPRCNKKIQVGLVDAALTPENSTQTCDIKEAIVAYLSEAAMERKRQDRNYPRITTTWRPDTEDTGIEQGPQAENEGILKLLSWVLVICSVLVAVGYSLIAYYTYMFQLNGNICENEES